MSCRGRWIVLVQCKRRFDERHQHVALGHRKQLVRIRISPLPSPQVGEARAKAVVKATTHFEDPKAVLEASEELGEAMPGLDVRQMEEKDLLSTRGW